MTLNIGINGFGRIGRIIFRTCIQNPGLMVSAVNDPAVDIDYMCYLIKFDSTHGKFWGTVQKSDNEITIDGHKIAIFREKFPTNIPWQIANVQYVVEASGMFTNLEKASGHLASDGVKRVLITAPCLDVPMVILGVNEEELSAGHKVISCASSTLYCLAPIIKILEDQFGVSEGFVTSVHAMTPSLKPLDGLCLKGKHWRDHRSIHQNIIPATTGACRALGKIIPQVKDKMMGLAFRVPIVNVSVLDITIRLKSNTSMAEIVREVENASSSCMQNIIKISNEQAVSSDFIGDTYSCILDVDSSLQLRTDFFKLICWYENEYSYACRIMDTISFMERKHKLEWKSQNLIQQKVSDNKFSYHQTCSYESQDTSKSLYSNSQDSGFKSPKLPIISKNTLYPCHLGTQKLPSSNRKTRHKDILKIWNDVDEMEKSPPQHKKDSLFHSCVAITPHTQFNANTYVKTRERLENVKKEFSKMVIMTENLLKQSQHSKTEVELSEVLSKNISNPSNIEKEQRICHTQCSLNNTSQYIASQSNENDCKHIKEKNKTRVVIDDAIILNTLPTNAGLLTNININETNTSINGSERNYSIISVKNKINVLNSTQDGDFSLGNINNTNGKLNNSIKDSTINKVSETIGHIDDKNVMQIPKSKGACKEQNGCKNNINDIPLLTSDRDKITHTEYLKCSKKCLKNTPCSQTKPSKAYDYAIANCNGNANNSSKIVDTYISETENTVSQDIQGHKLQQRLENALKKLALDTNAVSEEPSSSFSSNNRQIKHKQDIFDKLDSVSATDSENSFQMNERKSQVIKITDLTNSLEDLEKLDKICRIIEISDELSDQLLSALNTSDRKDLKNQKWSFKDLCEKIKLDDFCNKMIYDL